MASRHQIVENALLTIDSLSVLFHGNWPAPSPRTKLEYDDWAAFGPEVFRLSRPLENKLNEAVKNLGFTHLPFARPEYIAGEMGYRDLDIRCPVGTIVISIRVKQWEIIDGVHEKPFTQAIYRPSARQIVETALAMWRKAIGDLTHDTASILATQLRCITNDWAKGLFGPVTGGSSQPYHTAIDAAAKAGALIRQAVDQGLLFSGNEYAGLRAEIEAAAKGEKSYQVYFKPGSIKGDNWSPPPDWHRFCRAVYLLLDEREKPVSRTFAKDYERYLKEGCPLLADLIQTSASDEQDPKALYMPAAWFKDEFGITADALRKQAKRGNIKSKKQGYWNRYSVPDASTVWPHLVTYEPTAN